MAGANGMSTKGGPMAPKGRALPVGVTTAPVRPTRAAGGGSAGPEDRHDAAVARMRAAAARVNSAKTPEEARAGERAMSAAIRSLRAARGGTKAAPKPANGKVAPARPAKRAAASAAKKGPVAPKVKPAAPQAVRPTAKPTRPAAKPVYKHGGFEVAPNGRGGYTLSHPKTGVVLSDALTKNYATQLARYYSDPKSGKSAWEGALKGNKKDMDWVANWTAEGARRSAAKLKTVH